MSYSAPFAGLKVVDLSQGIAGPYCAMLLAQYGADVIKVETVGDGDWARTLGVRFGDHTAFSIIGNLGKRSVSVNLKTEAGKQTLWRLIDGADVFLEGFRPGVIDRLGFGYDAVRAREPRIMYVSISGFGQKGPLAERPAMDPVLAAYTGMTYENQTPDGTPHRMPVIVVDMSTALYAFQALSAGLYARRDEDQGRYFDVSLMQAAASLQSIRMMSSYLEGGAVRPGGVPQGVFKTADGWMTMVAIQDRDWKKICALLDIPDAATDPRFIDPPSRFENQDALYAIVRPLVGARTTAEMSELLTKGQIMHERINSYQDFLNEPHVKATELIQWLDQPGVETTVPVPSLPGVTRMQSGTPLGTAPKNGQHTRQVLTEHGFSSEEIERLSAEGAITIKD